MKQSQHAIIIGGGFGGLGTACILAKAGYRVTLLEKNEAVGGRASVLEADGYRFDMGPSWYLMPDVFEQFFEMLGEKTSDYFALKELDPSYRIFFKGDKTQVDLYKGTEKNKHTLEAIEPGSYEKFLDYLKRAEHQYDIALKRFMYKNYSSILDFFTWEVMTQGMKLSVFQKMDKYVKRFFKSEKLQQIMQYTLVFLGSSPYNTPALYNIMSHVDFNMGVYYPEGGMYKVIEALETIAKKNGVDIRTNRPVQNILTKDGTAYAVKCEDETIMEADLIISNADIHHTEMKLLDNPDLRSYDKSYWDNAVCAPSAFLMYLGVDGELPQLKHHTLMFASDWKTGFGEIFDHPTWPTDPNYYICNPSKTDPDVAPEGKENLFVLVPIAPGLEYSDEFLDEYGDKILDDIAEQIDVPDLKKRIEFKQYFCAKDFAARYNSFQGSALGLAHTLNQTAVFRPDTKSKTIDNLYYVGGNTNPGIGMPICLISAQLVYKQIIGDKSSGPIVKIGS